MNSSTGILPVNKLKNTGILPVNKLKNTDYCELETEKVKTSASQKFISGKYLKKIKIKTEIENKKTQN